MNDVPGRLTDDPGSVFEDPGRPAADPGSPFDIPGPDTVVIDGVTVGRGSRVRLRPSRRADIMDLALTGREAEVDAVQEDFEGQLHLAVLVRDDPGRDLGASGKIGHRFFFTPEEVEPIVPVAGGTVSTRRVLVAGVGNMFLADDGFGPEVVAALRDWTPPHGVHVVDFGIRGMDLAYRLLDGYDAAVLVDAAPRGEPPGTLTLLEPDLPEHGGLPEAHAMDPVRVLALARSLAGPGDTLPRVLVLGCEPLVRMTGEEPDVVVGLSDPVREAVARALPLVAATVDDLLTAAPHER